MVQTTAAHQNENKIVNINKRNGFKPHYINEATKCGIFNLHPLPCRNVGIGRPPVW